MRTFGLRLLASVLGLLAVSSYRLPLALAEGCNCLIASNVTGAMPIQPPLARQAASPRAVTLMEPTINLAVALDCPRYKIAMHVIGPSQGTGPHTLCLTNTGGRDQEIRVPFGTEISTEPGRQPAFVTEDTYVTVPAGSKQCVTVPTVCASNPDMPPASTHSSPGKVRLLLPDQTHKGIWRKLAHYKHLENIAAGRYQDLAQTASATTDATANGTPDAVEQWADYLLENAAEPAGDLERKLHPELVRFRYRLNDQARAELEQKLLDGAHNQIAKFYSLPKGTQTGVDEKLGEIFDKAEELANDVLKMSLDNENFRQAILDKEWWLAQKPEDRDPKYVDYKTLEQLYGCSDKPELLLSGDGHSPLHVTAHFPKGTVRRKTIVRVEPGDTAIASEPACQNRGITTGKTFVLTPDEPTSVTFPAQCIDRRTAHPGSPQPKLYMVNRNPSNNPYNPYDYMREFNDVYFPYSVLYRSPQDRSTNATYSAVPRQDLPYMQRPVAHRPLTHKYGPTAYVDQWITSGLYNTTYTDRRDQFINAYVALNPRQPWHNYNPAVTDVVPGHYHPLTPQPFAIPPTAADKLSSENVYGSVKDDVPGEEYEPQVRRDSKNIYSHADGAGKNIREQLQTNPSYLNAMDASNRRINNLLAYQTANTSWGNPNQTMTDAGPGITAGEPQPGQGNNKPAPVNNQPAPANPGQNPNAQQQPADRGQGPKAKDEKRQQKIQAAQWHLPTAKEQTGGSKNAAQFIMDEFNPGRRDVLFIGDGPRQAELMKQVFHEANARNNRPVLAVDIPKELENQIKFNNGKLQVPAGNKAFQDWAKDNPHTVAVLEAAHDQNIKIRAVGGKDIVDNMDSLVRPDKNRPALGDRVLYFGSAKDGNLSNAKSVAALVNDRLKMSNPGKVASFLPADPKELSQPDGRIDAGVYDLRTNQAKSNAFEELYGRGHNYLIVHPK